MTGTLFSISNSDIHVAALNFVPEKLELARDWAGFTKAMLADKIGKTASAVSQFESGNLKPDASTIARLSLALAVPVNFFTRRMRVPPLKAEACHYRRLRSASQRHRRQLQARGTLLIEVIKLLNEHIELQSEDVSRLASTPRSSVEIEELAGRVRSEWGLGLGPVSNVVQLLENKGVIISNIPSANRDVDAFSAWFDGIPLVFLVSEKGSASRTRFDALHELGHLIMHADVVPGDRELERQADMFASAFLMPRESFLQECPTSFRYDHFVELKKRWKVSIAALVRRAYDLGRLSEASYRRAYVFLNQNGLRGNEPMEPAYEYPVLLETALKYASDELPISKLAAEVGLSVRDLQNLVSH